MSDQILVPSQCSPVVVNLVYRIVVIVDSVTEHRQACNNSDNGKHN